VVCRTKVDEFEEIQGIVSLVAFDGDIDVPLSAISMLGGESWRRIANGADREMSALDDARGTRGSIAPILWRPRDPFLSRVSPDRTCRHMCQESTTVDILYPHFKQIQRGIQA
jgi:hypothetical protein